MSRRALDAVVIGGGHNGLVCAAYLARAGLATVVIEASDRPGGAAQTGELAPGFMAPTYAHTVGRLRPSVVRDLGLARFGLRLVAPDVRVFAPRPDGGSVTLWSDPLRTAEGLRSRSPADAEAWPRFDRKVRSVASLLAHVHASTPPDLRSPSLGDALEAVRLGRGLRRLGSPSHTREVLRILPMAVADLAGEAFEDEALRGAVAARGVQLAALGPWSAGTAAVLLADAAGNDGGAAGQSTFVLGGPGALIEALVGAVRSFGGEIRTSYPVEAVISNDGRATGVVLASGEEVEAPVVVSAVDPKRTLTRLVDPVALGPTLVWRASNIRMPGVVAKVNLALDGLPTFPGAAGDPSRLHGRILIAPGIDALERAFDASKYGRVSEHPFLEVTIPTLTDPALVPEGKHVMSVIAQFAPYHLRQGDWDSGREALGEKVLEELETVAPGLSGLVRARQVITPLDLERDLGMTEGHPLHGEPGLDQWWAWRPLLGLARYRLPLEGLYLAGSGAHPGGGVTGAPGANAAREILSDLGRRP